MSSAGWETVVGLEIHCQLETRTKLFCGCANAFGGEPNAHTCPVCTAQPGALPVLNRAAVELAVKAALALGGELPELSRFDRKSYFYCDLPKGYQISQYERPFCSGARIPLPDGRSVRLVRIHMEEDAGKAIHDRGDATLVDLNRAGVPLIEAVTEAEIGSAEDAVAALESFRAVLRYVGASDGDMEKGSLRCDVNVSVRRPGEPLRTKVELKNLNSFRHVAAAIEHEVRRQVEAYESGDPARSPVQETRLWDSARGETRPMRGKEEAHDYRYFPEPDLAPLRVGAALREALRRELPELPLARRARYRAELGLSAYDAAVLTARRDVADWFEELARLSGSPKEAANWVSNELLRALGEAAGPERRSTAELPTSPAAFAELIGLVEAGTVSHSAARTLARHLLAEGGAPRELARTLGLEQVRDEARLEAWCRAAIAANERAADDVRAGKERALGALVGAVMKLSAGKCDPVEARKLLLGRLGSR